MYRYVDRKKQMYSKLLFLLSLYSLKPNMPRIVLSLKKNPDVICPDFLVEFILLNVFFELPASTYCNRILHMDLPLIQNNTGYRIPFQLPDTEL